MAGGALHLSAVSADALHCGDAWGKALSWGSGGTRMALEGAWVPETGSVQGEARTAAKGTRAHLAKCVSLPCALARPSCLPGHNLDLLHLDVPGFSPRQTGSCFCCSRQCLANHPPLQPGSGTPARAPLSGERLRKRQEQMGQQFGCKHKRLPNLESLTLFLLQTQPCSASTLPASHTPSVHGMLIHTLICICSRKALTCSTFVTALSHPNRLEFLRAEARGSPSIPCISVLK